MYEFDAPTIIAVILMGLAFTWIPGLLPPLLIRYVFIKRPLSKHAAFLVCAVFWFFNVVLANYMGSQSKTHGALFLVAWVSYFILRRKPAPKESVPADTRATEVLATRERWYKKMIFRPSWRLVVSTIPLAFLLALAAFYGAAGESQKEVARYLEWTPERRTHCEEALAKERATTIQTTQDSMSLRLLEAACTPPEQPKEGMYYYYLGKNLREAFLAWVVLSASLFALLTITAIYFRESERGWKRLSTVAAGLLAVISGLITLILSDGKTVVAFLSAVAAFPVGILLILGGRSVVKWVRAGFTSSKQT